MDKNMFVKEKLQQLVDNVEKSENESLEEIKDMFSYEDQIFEQDISLATRYRYLVDGIKKIIA